MSTRYLMLALASLALFFSGCATGFRAGGPHAGVEGGAAVGTPPLYIQGEPPVAK